MSLIPSLVLMSLFLFVGLYLILLVGSCSPFARSSILRSVLLVVMVVLGTECKGYKSDIFLNAGVAC